MNAGIVSQTLALPKSHGNFAIEFCQAGISMSILEIRGNVV